MIADAPTVVHVTTVDLSLEGLLGAQLEAIAAAGYRVIGVSAPGPYVEALSRRGIEHVPLAHSTRAMAPLEDARAAAELTALLRRIRPSIVHTHTPKPSIYGRVAARLARVPVIVNTVHGLYALPEDTWPKRLAVYGAERLAASCSHAELVASPEDLQMLRRLRVPADRLVPLDAGLGIDLARFNPDAITTADRISVRRELGATSDDDVVVGVVGRLVREKGYPEIFAAARQLASRGRPVRVAVIGPDEPEKADRLTDVDRSEAQEADVRFLGARNDVVRLYAGMDIFVLASRREGFPLTLMEAAAMGLPAVATDIRGCRQIVEHGATGLLVPVGDPMALAAAIERLATDPHERRRFGVQARRKAEARFDHRRCIDVTLATYERLLSRAGIATPARDRGGVSPSSDGELGRRPSGDGGELLPDGGMRHPPDLTHRRPC